MSRQSPLRVDDMSHEPKYRGKNIGRPTVKVTFGADEKNTVASTLNLFNKYNWDRKIRNGNSFLVLRGHRPLHSDNREGIESLLYNVNPPYCEIQATGFHEPSREIKSHADNFLIDLKDYEAEYDEYAMEYFAQQSRNLDACDFAFRWQGRTPTERVVKLFKREHKVYPHNIYLYTNEDVDMKSDWRKHFEDMQSLSVQYGWNVIPPFEYAVDEYDRLEQELMEINEEDG